MSETAQIETKEQFGPKSPTSSASRWQVELAAAKKAHEDFVKDGKEAVKEFLGETSSTAGARLNLFYSDVKTQEASLSGTPKVRCRRRYADANDDVARVSAEILDRMLNADIEQRTDDANGFREALDEARRDWLLSGLGQVRFRFIHETEPTEATAAQMGPCPGCQGAGQVPEPMSVSGIPMSCDECQGTGQKEIAPAVPAGEKTTKQDVDAVYVNWEDFLWSPCRTWSEVRWVAFRAEMTKTEAGERFGDAVAATLPKKSKVKVDGLDEKAQDAWSRIETWEIWDRDTRTTLWYVEGHDKILDEKRDMLELPGFFPCPKPLAANLTSSKFIPRSNYYLAKSLYEEAHALTRRIRALVKQIKVVGAYSKANPEVARILEESCDNEMVGLDNWGAFSEAGGFNGALAFLPIEPQVKALAELVQQRNLVRQEIAETLGTSDIMRGQSAQKVTATTDRIKARAFSTRVKVPQDEYARFASAAQRIRAQIICRWFDPEIIAMRSNMANTPDAELLQPAIEMLKQDASEYRIDVDAEELSMTDFDAVKQDNLEFLKGTAEYFGAVAPIALDPSLKKFFVSLYQQSIAGLRGAHRFEPIVDRFIADIEEQAKQPPMPPPPDPKVEQEKIKTQGMVVKAQLDERKGQMDMQGKVMDLQLKKAELGMKAQGMAMDAEAKREEHSMRQEEMEMGRESMHDEHAMASEERQEEHALAAESRHADHAAHMQELKAKPKGGDK